MKELRSMLALAAALSVLQLLVVAAVPGGIFGELVTSIIVVFDELLHVSVAAILVWCAWYFNDHARWW